MEFTAFIPARPEISLAAILIYSFLTFLVGILATPWFLSFLRENRIGKQLRVEAVDGKEASVFRHFHQKKAGTGDQYCRILIMVPPTAPEDAVEKVEGAYAENPRANLRTAL